jgi:hypothetical protein
MITQVHRFAAAVSRSAVPRRSKKVRSIRVSTDQVGWLLQGSDSRKGLSSFGEEAQKSGRSSEESDFCRQQHQQPDAARAKYRNRLRNRPRAGVRAIKIAPKIRTGKKNRTVLWPTILASAKRTRKNADNKPYGKQCLYIVAFCLWAIAYLLLAWSQETYSPREQAQ